MVSNNPLISGRNSWDVACLKDISIKIGSGSTPRGGESAYIPERINFAFIRSQNIYDFKFDVNGLKFISDEDANKLKGVHLQKDDVLLNITGDGVTFSRCCLVPDDILPAAVNQHVAIIRLDTTKCLPGYLMAYLCLPETKAYIESFNAGGSRRAITKGHIESFEIPLPPMHIQGEISKIALSLLAKQDINTQINQTQEQMAQALFKSWFVDFDPVVDNQGGSILCSIFNQRITELDNCHPNRLF
jgi:type I restriction enzyme, S subunit